MLESVFVRPDTVDLGELAEALVYYGRVRVEFQTLHLIELVNKIGIDGLTRLAESEDVKLVFSRRASAVMTNENLLYPHAFMGVFLSATEDGRQIRSAADEIHEAFQRKIGRGAVPEKQVRRLADALELRETPPPAVAKAALQDVLDARFLTTVVQTILRNRFPEYPGINQVWAEGAADNDNFYIKSNVNYELPRRILVQRSGNEQSTFGPADFASPIIRMRDEMYYSGGSLSDLWLDDIHSQLLRAKINSFLSKFEKGRERIDRFEEHVFSGRSFASALETGERTILDILDFREAPETRKFKAWMRSAPPNADLFAEYEKSKISPSSLASSLPFKAAKWVLFAGAGAVLDKLVGGSGVLGGAMGMTADVALGAAEDALSSHLSLGWKPNQWVTRIAGPFVRAA